MIINYLADLPDIEYSDFRSLIDDVSSRYPENIAFRMRDADDRFRETSFSVAYRRIRALASYLLRSGIGKGDRVGLLSENREEWAISYLATVYAGIVIVPFDIHTSTEGLVAYASFADLSALIHSSHFFEQALKMSYACQDCGMRICLDRDQDGSRRDGKGTVVQFREVLEAEKLFSGEAELPELTPRDPASIIFTSGTTGSPKGVTLSHHGIIANVNASYQSLPIDEHDNFVAVLPFHHTYPTTCSLISPYSMGGTVTIVDRIVGSRIIADVRDSGGTILIGVPLLFEKLKKGMQGKFKQLPPPAAAAVDFLRGLSRLGISLGLPLGRFLFRSLRSKAGLASLRLLVSGGGPLAASTADFFQELGFTIVQGYGMSENGPLITTNTVKHFDNRSAGLQVKHTRVRIANPDDDGIGEIEVTSPSLMLGYFRNPEATTEVFTHDGYLRTGDLGYMDDRGFFFISGRSKNMIVTAGGKNVFPEEIEAQFPEAGPIGEVMIMGEELEKGRGERIIAVCVPDYDFFREKTGGSLPSEAEIETKIHEEITEINRRLESYRKIEKVVIRKEEFEKTAGAKIKRFLYKDYAGIGVSEENAVR